MSFDSLKRTQDDGRATHQQFARELGLLHDDVETKAMLTDSTSFLTSTAKLCELMAETFVWLDLSDPVNVWEHFCSLLRIHQNSTDLSQVWASVETCLQSYSISLVEFGISQPDSPSIAVHMDRAAQEYVASMVHMWKP